MIPTIKIKQMAPSSDPNTQRPCIRYLVCPTNTSLQKPKNSKIPHVRAQCANPLFLRWRLWGDFEEKIRISGWLVKVKMEETTNENSVTDDFRWTTNGCNVHRHGYPHNVQSNNDKPTWCWELHNYASLGMELNCVKNHWKWKLRDLKANFGPLSNFIV